MQLMQSMGWRRGGVLGRAERGGLVSALEGEGQKPSDKTGFGFRGPKLVRRQLGAPGVCLLYTSPSPRDLSTSRMPSSA